MLPTADFLSNSTMKTWACIVCLFTFMFVSAISRAAEEPPFRVLVLHGEWNMRIGMQTFDQQFAKVLSEQTATPVDLSFQSLAVGPSADPEVVEFYRSMVNGIIDTLEVDLIVATLPNTVSFIQSLDSYMSVPMVLVLPSKTDDYSSLPTDKFRVVQSPMGHSIRKTLIAAIKLQPEASKIEVFSGPIVDELGLVDEAAKIIEQEFSSHELVTHIGMPIADTLSYLASVGEDSIILTLPALSFDAIQPEQIKRIFRQFSDASTQPVYGIAEFFLGSGVTGGYYYTSEHFADSAAAAVVSLLTKAPFSSYAENVSSSYVFDYEEVKHRNLDLSRLGEPYKFVNQPKSYFQENRITVLISSVVFLLFCVALYFLYIALKKSEAAKKQLELSEQEARESKLRYELLTANTQDVLWVWDQDKLETTYCSPAIEQLTGYTPAEFIELELSDYIAGSSLEEATKRIAGSKLDSNVFEVELIKRDSTRLWCEVAVHPIMEDSKFTNQWVGVTRDITKRKQEEGDRLALESQLRQSQKFESLGTLAGGIAHDFNNMLGVMVGLNELLKLKTTDNPSATAIIDKLIVTTDRAKSLVGQILAFSRQSDLNKTQMNIVELANDALQIVQSGILKTIKLNNHLADEPIEVLADPNQVSQVFMIILTNAYEALEQEQGEIDFSIKIITIASMQECLHGRLEPGRYAKITVSDNGLGVSKERIEKIFDPFYTSKDLGTGMGLSVARGIVIAHNGGIDFTSVPFKGSTISIYLPALVTKPRETVQFSEDSAPRRSKILLIDDQVDLLETVAMMLDAIGHDCIQCSDSNEAMELITGSEVQFDLVITDYSMPGVSGLDIARATAEKRPNIPVILATGYNEPADTINGNGATEYEILNKPFGFNELKTLISKVLATKPI